MKTISLEQSVALIPDGATVMIGGFMAVGTRRRRDREAGQARPDGDRQRHGDPTKGIVKLVAARLLRKANRRSRSSAEMLAPRRVVFGTSNRRH